MRWSSGVIAALLAAGCGPSAGPTLKLVVTPVVLRDDGTVARVRLWVAGPDDEPLAGKVELKSSAGSLFEPRTLELDSVGSANTTFNCEAKADSRCRGSVTVEANWHDLKTAASARVELTLITTDAEVAACASANRRRLRMLDTLPAQLRLAVLEGALETSQFSSAQGEGVALYDPQTQLGALAFTFGGQLPTASAEEQRVMLALSSLGTVSNPLRATFQTWEGFDAVRTGFDFEGPVELKARLDALASALSGQSTGLTGASAAGPFKAVMSVVRAFDGQTSVVLALTGRPEAALLLDDVAGGSALANSSDGTVERCDVFELGQRPKVDFVWVVDDSCSMQTSQNAVARVGSQIADRVRGAWLDVRFAGVTTGYYGPTFDGSVRGFSADVAAMLSWFIGPGAWGISGSGSEQGFAGLQSFFDGVGPRASAINAVREGAELHLLFMSDAPEQSKFSAEDMLAYFHQKFPGQKVIAHGIVCPEGETCGDGKELPVGKYHSLVRQTGGVLGSIKVYNPPTVTKELADQQSATMNAILHAVVGSGGFGLQYRPISASVRVATSATLGVCDNTDVPRDDDNGWRVEPTTGRIVFAGACVPPPTARVAVSYLSWKDSSTPLHTWGQGVLAAEVPRDAGADAGKADAGALDAGAVDAGPADAGSVDAGGVDGGGC